jgi:methionyl aminopeptidase
MDGQRKGISGFVQDENGSPVPIHDAEGIEGLRRAGRLAAATLDMVSPFVVPGASTGSLDRMIREFMGDHGAVPATLGYNGYPASSCISVNYVVTHGIPRDDKRLAEGDIANIDVTVLLDGWHGDTSRTWTVGEKVGLKARRLVDCTRRALMAGISEVGPGKRLGDIGSAIEGIAQAERFSVVTEYCGHGIGRGFHQAPQVLHTGKRGHGLVMLPGMYFTIEPMLNAGRPETFRLADGWTVVTRDKSLSAQFEHQVLVTETGAEILTTGQSQAFD